MCSLFYVDASTLRDIRCLTGERELNENHAETGDVRPSLRAVILAGGYGSLKTESMKWGFPSYDKTHLLINARAETVMKKRSFSDSVLHRRCVIPAKAFYEWDSDKNKAMFTLPDGSSLYMAGFYSIFGEEKRFVILTTQANDSIKKVHDRMPLILPKELVRDWIFDDDRAVEILKRPSPMLEKYQEYEQLTLF